MDYTHEIKQYSNELHKRVVKNFPTRKINVNFKNEIFGIDLADMITYKDENDGYAYIFVIEDLFTRKAWTIPLKDKKSKTVAIALDKLFTAIQSHPLYIWSDKGGEFYNTDMTKLLKKYNIHHYSVYGQSKVAPVERLNQTLKHIMFKKLTEMQSHRWIDILEYVIDKYNNNKHSSIGISPNQAYQNPEHIKHKVDLDVKPYIQTSTDKPKYHLGDYVRVSRLKGNFEKGYDANFTSEIFQIVEIDNSYPITYKLNDLMPYILNRK